MSDRANLSTMASRLDRMIARLLTQRVFLDHAATLLKDLPGPILEIGLGKGRTFSHLRLLFPDRTIFAFDREIHAPEDCVPEMQFMLLGDFHQSVPAVAAKLPAKAALAHADIGTFGRAGDAELAKFLAGQLSSLLAPGGLVVTDREMRAPLLQPLAAPAAPMPAGIEPWPYFIYRRTA